MKGPSLEVLREIRSRPTDAPTSRSKPLALVENPILTFAEIPLLEGKSDAAKRALLTTLGAMPGSRVVQ